MDDHVGINISSLSSVRTVKWFSNVPGGGVCQAWIKYDSDLKNLSVSFTGFQNNKSFRQDRLITSLISAKYCPNGLLSGFQQRQDL
ncbi:putative legume lectin domain, concanavalin A-like lectin/glucanase domain superfamily [Helianthus anomalus]